MKNYLPIFLVSLAIIAYQLLLIQVLSLVQWYHFAYMIISIALLGFGASGTLLSVLRRPAIRHARALSPLFLWCCGLLMMISLRLSQTSYLAFDSYLVFQDTAHLLRLIAVYLLFLLPFLSGALYLGLRFRLEPENIGKLYFFNLTGSAAGGLLAIFLLRYLAAQQAIAFIALFPLAAAALTAVRKIKTASVLPLRWLIIITATLVIAIMGIITPHRLYLSEYKSLSKVLNLPETSIIAEKTSPYGLLQGVSSPYLRYAPGLSLHYRGEIPFETVIFNNGEFTGPLFPPQEELSDHFYDYSTLSLPFRLASLQHALILDSGSGDLASYALHRKFPKITTVTGNPALVAFIKEDLRAKAHSSVYDDPALRVVSQEPYSFLLTDKNSYNLISLPLTDAFGGSAGIFAMNETYLLTDEGFQQMWNRLSSDGIITISTWIDYPLRYPLKTLAALTGLLENNGISDPESHITAIRNWSLLTFVLRKSPLSEADISLTRSFAAEMGFDLLLLPGLREEERTKFNVLSDDSLFRFSDKIISSGRSELFHKYPFNIEPATEDRPYFFQFLKLTSIPELLQDFGIRELPFLELGYLLVIFTFFQIVILTALLIILPLLIKRWSSPGKLRTFFYFSFLGLGFMMLEIVLIQRFIFYLGTPLYSTAAVISAVLLFSGIGSNFSSRLSGERKHFSLILAAIVVLIFIYSLILSPLLHATLHLNLLLRILLTIIFLAPLAFLLGFPFPLGIRTLAQKDRSDNITWAWGINGSFSVVSTVLATIIAVEYGFTIVMFIAAGCYFAAIFSNLLLREK
jgi:hypothetical protein